MRAWLLDDSLLPGEDPVHIRDGDVEHWVSVYEELLAGNRRILREIGGVSLPLQHHMAQLEIGLAFWTRQLHRADALELPFQPAPTERIATGLGKRDAVPAFEVDGWAAGAASAGADHVPAQVPRALPVHVDVDSDLHRERAGGRGAVLGPRHVDDVADRVGAMR